LVTGRLEERVVDERGLWEVVGMLGNEVSLDSMPRIIGIGRI
jgi:hypothetical protein